LVKDKQKLILYLEELVKIISIDKRKEMLLVLSEKVPNKDIV